MSLLRKPLALIECDVSLVVSLGSWKNVEGSVATVSMSLLCRRMWDVSSKLGRVSRDRTLLDNSCLTLYHAQYLVRAEGGVEALVVLAY